MQEVDEVAEVADAGEGAVVNVSVGVLVGVVRVGISLYLDSIHTVGL